MKRLRTMFILPAILMMPVSAAYSVLPEVKAAGSQENASAISGQALPDISELPPAEVLGGEEGGFIPASFLDGSMAGEAGFETQLQQDLFLDPAAHENHSFWFRSPTFLLSGASLFGFLALFMSFGGNGDEAVSGNSPDAAAGAGEENPSVPVGGIPAGVAGGLGGGTLGVSGGSEIPHNPEPSSFLLLGAGVLFAFAMKRK